MAMSVPFSVYAVVIIQLVIMCLANSRDIHSVKHDSLRDFSSSINSLVEELKSLKEHLPLMERRILDGIAKAETSMESKLMESVTSTAIEKIVNKTLSKILEGELNSGSNGHNGEPKIGTQSMSEEPNSVGKERDGLKVPVREIERDGIRLENQSSNIKEDLNRTKQGKKIMQSDIQNRSTMGDLSHVCSSLKKTLDEAVTTIVGNINTTNQNLKTISNSLNRTSECPHFPENQIQNDVSVSIGNRLNSSVKPVSNTETKGLSNGDRSKGSVKSPSVTQNPESKGVSIGDKMNSSVRQMDTTGPDAELKRILVIPRATQEFVHPHLIHVHYNTVSVYRHLRTSRVNCATYDPTTNRIVFSRYRPYGIFSSKVGVDRLEILRDNVGSAGMAVDAGRNLIFMTTLHPRKTISKMDTSGKHFRGILDLDGPRTHPAFSLAIDEKREVIYFCQFDRLVSVGYNGNNMQELESGRRRLYALVFDHVADCLYFSQNRKVIRKNLKNGENSDIIVVDPIWKMLMQNGSLYLSSLKGVGIDVVNINPGHNVHFNLWKMKHNNNDIVLIP